MSDNIGRSVFGQKVALPDISQFALEQELMDYTSGDVFKIDGGDPNYIYLWPIDPRRDSKTKLALQHGVYEAVTTSNEPKLITHGQTRLDGEYIFLNEHILCKMTKERWDKRQALKDHENLSRERRIEESFKNQVGDISRGAAVPSVAINENTRVATSWE